MAVHQLCQIAAVAAVTAACGVGSSSSPAGQASGPSSPTTSQLSASSTIHDGARLSDAIEWTETPEPPAEVTEVIFAIDGKTRWVEHNPPYTFNDDHGLLSTYLLGNGAHVLTTTSVGPDGTRSRRTTHVTVLNARPATPTALLGTWQRRLTRADEARPKGQPDFTGQDMPKGLWTLTIHRDGLVDIDDPSREGLQYQISATPQGRLTAYGPANWTLPAPADLNPRYGFFCAHLHEARDTFAWSRRATHLTISGGANCADRDALFDGTWEHVTS